MRKCTQRKRNSTVFIDGILHMQIKYKDMTIDVLLSPEDEWVINVASWSYNPFNGYIQGGKQGQKLYLHTTLCPHNEGYYTDHINGNKLDNRRSNLRIVSPRQSQMNTNRKGVNFRKDRNKWRAYIIVNGKFTALGMFSTEEEALKARRNAELKYFGEYAKTRGDDNNV